MLTTLQGVINGLRYPINYNKGGTNGSSVSGAFNTSSFVVGDIGAMVTPFSGLAGNTLVGWASGALPFTNPVSGETVLARSQLRQSTSSASGGGFLVDRLWHNSGLDRTLTTAQTVNSVAWPARDINGSTNGEGVFIGIETVATMGTGAPTISMTYTNSAGVGGRVASNVALNSASWNAGVLLVMGLQAGDTGVRSIQDVTFSVSWGASGGLSLVAFRPIAYVPSVPVAARPSSQITVDDAISLVAPRIPDNAFLQFWAIWMNGSAAAIGANGHFLFSQG